MQNAMRDWSWGHIKNLPFVSISGDSIKSRRSCQEAKYNLLVILYSYDDESTKESFLYTEPSTLKQIALDVEEIQYRPVKYYFPEDEYNYTRIGVVHIEEII